ncbi:hypothetical protein M513_00105, partial [Trichuris suis]
MRTDGSDALASHFYSVNEHYLNRSSEMQHLLYQRRHRSGECNDYQDACIKMVVYLLDDGKYWLAKGCTNRMPFIPTGCHQTQTEMQEVGMDSVHRPGLFRAFSGTAMQDVCICETNNCNASFLPATNILKIFLPLALLCAWHY